MKSLKFFRGAFASMFLALVGLGASPSAVAADGCKFLLCIAGPWNSISECVPTVHEVFRDMAKGKPFPTCDMSGDGNNASNQAANARNCPSMYKEYNENGNYVSCRYPNVIDVKINGQPWSTVFWDYSGNTTTYWTQTALSSLNQPGAAPLDQSFQRDANAWYSKRLNQCAVQGSYAVFFDLYGVADTCYYP